ncbi:ABC transporter family substrate-binding protein [Herbidospora sp. NEAU-GS84]|uniref:ABC transporter family substrate-binding protein n=1 Tax=Herbidospora solisilvae TaxID=2696284 RepID=A0A7C9NZ44_9ACTN|nr:ABC transporter family substrate-binding protein [Herbidospora solisilvae]NAS21377.1 ABC transporter family substrate-binding protein [Herbidospora solisilvae]
MKRACALLLALTTAACAAQPGTPGEQAAPVTAADLNLTPRAEVKTGGTLRWGLTEYPAQWNQNHIDGNHTNVKTVMDALMPRPFRADEHGVLALDPDYVAAADVTSTSPKQVVTYTLNPKARWSTGQPITWADYDAQWRALRGKDPAFHVANVTGYQDIASVARGRDDFQVVVTFARPFGDWRSLFAPLYPKSATASPQAFNAGWVGKIPVTAGPFRFGAFDTRAKTITLNRDEKWWGEPAKLDSIVFRGLESDARVAAFANGELDVFDIGPSAADLSRAKSAEGAVVRQAAGPDFRHFTFNGESPILSDIRVRQAVALGIDRAVIAKSDLKGLNWPVTLLDNHFLMNSQQGYRPNAGELAGPDAARAGALLDAAGWRMNGAVRQKAGKQLDLRFVIPSGLQLARSEGEITQAMLAKLGIKLTIETVPSNDFFTKYVIPGNYDIAPFSYVGTPFPVSASYGTYADGVRSQGDDISWNANLGRSGNAEIDTKLRAAMAELDPAKALKLINEADRLVWREVNVLPLYQRPQTVAVDAKLANVGARGFRDLDYADIGFVS